MAIGPISLAVIGVIALVLAVTATRFERRRVATLRQPEVAASGAGAKRSD